MKRAFFILFAAVALALAPGSEKAGLATGTVMKVQPASIFVSPSSGPFDVPVWATDVQTSTCEPIAPGQPCGLGSFTIRLAFDTSIITCEDLNPSVAGCQNVTNGTFLTSTGRRVDAFPGFCQYDSPDNDPANGVIKYSCVTTGNPPGGYTPLGPLGQGLLATLKFRPVPGVTGVSALDLQDTVLPNFQGTRLSDIQGREISHATQDGTVTVNYVADLAVSKTGPATVTAPGNVTYNIQVNNSLGPDSATNVTAVDSLPSQVVYQSNDSGCSYDSGQNKVTCALGTMTRYQTKSVNITGSVAATYAGQTLTNTVDVTTTVADPVSSNNHAQATTQVSPSNLSITKTVPSDVNLSEVAPYTIIATSTGTSTAAAVYVTDVLPTQVQYVSASSTLGSCSYSSPTRTVLCSLGDMAPGASAKMTIQVTFGTSPAVVCNTASASWTPTATRTASGCTFVAEPDTDGDGCRDINEQSANHLKGGGRDYTNPWDFFDTVRPIAADPVPNGVAAGYGASNKDTDEDVGKAAGNTRRAQGFKIASPGSVDRVLLYIRKQGSPTDSLTVQIQSDSGGLPSGTAVWDGTSAAVSGAGLGTSYGWVAFTFPRWPALASATQYHLVLTRSGATNNSNYYQWGGDASNPGYADGTTSVYNGSTWALLIPPHDEVFYVLSAKDRAVSLLDVLATLKYVPSPPPGGTLDTPNVNGVAYNADKNLDGVADGRGYDRSGAPLYRGPPDGTISLLDVLGALKQVPDNCVVAP